MPFAFMPPKSATRAPTPPGLYGCLSYLDYTAHAVSSHLVTPSDLQSRKTDTHLYSGLRDLDQITSRAYAMAIGLDLWPLSDRACLLVLGFASKSKFHVRTLCLLSRRRFDLPPSTLQTPATS